MGKQRYRSLVAAFLLLEKGETSDSVLLGKRKNTGYRDGQYCTVAGHMEEGETAPDCIVREAKEEVGIIIKPEDISVVHVMHRNVPGLVYFDFYCHCSRWTGEPRNAEPDKCSSIGWFSKTNLPNTLIDHVRVAFDYIQSGVPYSEYGWQKAHV